ncbi:GldG family protein [Candidatus Sumerlaeota bacterium]|nr:GldG family protein [Candidatus Sumerlaeota bacterium]
MQRKMSTIVGLVLIAVIVLAANLIAGTVFKRAKIDMTEENLYTLSDGSINVLNSLDDTIAASFYYSRTAAAEIPQFKAYAERVLQLLEEYQAMSKGRFALEVLDPRPDTEIELTADRYGLQGVPLPSGERVFLGLVLKDQAGRDESIPFFSDQREPYLEYDVSKAIYSISHPEKEKVGVLSPLPIMGAGAENPFMRDREPRFTPWVFIEELRKTFRLEQIDLAAERIPDDIQLLLIVHPKDLSGPLLYAIDQYVLKGGRVVVFADPFAQIESQYEPEVSPEQRMALSYASDLPALFQAWGIELEKTGSRTAMPGAYEPGKDSKSPGIVVDPNLAYSMPTRQGYQDVPVWLRLSPENCDPHEIVTANLDSLLMICAGSIKKTTASPDIEVTPLIQTTDVAALMDDVMFRAGAFDPEQMRREFKPGSSKLTLAAKITGKFKTAFPKGAQPTRDETASPALPDGHLAESRSPGTIVVVADVDVISDAAAVRIQNLFGQRLVIAQNDNLSLVHNAVENLTGSDDLIALRSRGSSDRPFTTVQAILRKANQEFQAEEKRLNAELDKANQRLAELQRGTEEHQILNAAYMAEVEGLRRKTAETSSELRKVRKNMREDIERLGAWLKFVNIALVPLLVVVCSIVVAWLNALNRRRALRNQAAGKA